MGIATVVAREQGVEGWTDVSVGALARFSSGQGISVSALHSESHVHSVPVYGGNGIAGYTEAPCVFDPTIVVGRVGQRCGEVHITDGPSWVTDNALYPVRILQPLDLHFFGLALSAAGLNDVKNRNDLPLVTQTILHSVRIPWPLNIGEQKAIAAALSDVDALLGALNQLIAKKRDLKQAAMQQLLTGQTRLPGFSDKWSGGTLADVIGSLDAGVSVNSVEDYGGGRHDGMYILKTSAVAGGRFIPQECKRIAPKDLGRARLSPRKQTLLVSRMNTPDLVGECGYVDRDYPNLFVPDRIWMTRFKQESDASALWLSYVLNTPALKRQIGVAATGTSGSMKNLSKSAFLQIPMTFPSGAEQYAIAEVLADIDAELSALEQRRDKTRLLKQGMMQELLTGRTRLV